ncbi:hypothetical protein E5Q_03000 [Mixia osmundae IAM 14324]|uniref:ABC1 atypical kinase-like domain-containing protein n=1 Tax=Mixia osmundae (strain CBS 9802 / IAM 14324 / JCM 22182 / KY 12970) TaxID=764103 RepID=G7E0H4_MIXOS|nr:hypothetical protein E5Q_03000 [Mixia osmundae IAM 14324]
MQLATRALSGHVVRFRPPHAINQWACAAPRFDSDTYSRQRSLHSSSRPSTRTAVPPSVARLNTSTRWSVALATDSVTPLAEQAPVGTTESQAERKKRSRRKRQWRRLGLTVAIVLSVGFVAYETVRPFRLFTLAIGRCTLVGIAVGHCIVDYKLLFRRTFTDKEERHQAYEACHKKCAERILEVLKTNGGIYIKLGQHLSSVQLIPTAWSSTMVPLQDQCNPTPVRDIEQLFLTDLGVTLQDQFTDFDPDPIGVASLAQVHVGTDKRSGKRVAIKLMHPDLEDFAYVDMKTTTFMLRVVKSFFPDFEFTWLGEEMEENLPLEMDFRHEAANARRATRDFQDLKTTSLVIPEVLWSERRVMVMEYIQGGRVDDLKYLHDHNIDRNRVSQELSRIFSQMLYINGFFHGDPHGGNLLIRPAQPHSRSPYNFEIVLLDHGLYFDVDRALRTNYARLWLSLIARPSAKTEADRRKYAKLVGNIDDDLYPIFESAITGRASLGKAGGGSMMDLANQTPEEAHRIRVAVVEEGLLTSIFDLLRRVPRRLLMVLKLNDLTRSLDTALKPTHPPYRIWLIVAEFCTRAVWQDDQRQLSEERVSTGLSLSLIRRSVSSWFGFQLWHRGLLFAETLADLRASWVLYRDWITGLTVGGFEEARRRRSGLHTLD